jgi:hypothetical protein
MEDFAFNWPKKILVSLVLGAWAIAGVYGVVTGDLHKAGELFGKEMTFITKPMVNFAQKRIERITSSVFKSLGQPPPKVAAPH